MAINIRNNDLPRSEFESIRNGENACVINKIQVSYKKNKTKIMTVGYKNIHKTIS